MKIIVFNLKDIWRLLKKLDQNYINTTYQFVPVDKNEILLSRLSNFGLFPNIQFPNVQIFLKTI